MIFFRSIAAPKVIFSLSAPANANHSDRLCKHRRCRILFLLLLFYRNRPHVCSLTPLTAWQEIRWGATIGARNSQRLKHPTTWWTNKYTNKKIHHGINLHIFWKLRGFVPCTVHATLFSWKYIFNNTRGIRNINWFQIRVKLL